MIRHKEKLSRRILLPVESIVGREQMSNACMIDLEAEHYEFLGRGAHA